MSQTGEISLCTQILQNAISPSVGLLIYYCGLCQQGFTSEAEVNTHVSQHFSSVKFEATPPPSNLDTPMTEEVPVPTGTPSSEDEKENIQRGVIQQQQEPTTPANNTYYILIPQSQVTTQQSNTIYINGSTNLTDNTALTSNPGAITLAVNNQTIPGVQQTSNGTTLYQIIQDPQTTLPDRPTTPDDSDLTDRRMSTSSSEYQILENGRHNSEPQLFTMPQMVTELPIGTSHSSQLALVPQNGSEMQNTNFRLGFSSQMSGHFKKRHVCDICNRAFTQRGSLKYHRMLHTGEKPFQCNVCNKSFRIRAPYDAHMDVHNGVRYRCSICLKYYSSRATLRQHLKGQHPNMSHPPISSCGFQCSSINLASEDVDSAIK